MRPRSVVVVACAAGLVTLLACLGATEAVVEIRTDVPYDTGRLVELHTGATGRAAESGPPVGTIEGPWQAPADLGSITMVPGGSKSGTFAFTLVMGVGRSASACSIAQPDGCIFVRRTTSFLPHEQVSLTVTIRAACLGVACDADTTCNALGQCVSAVVDANACKDNQLCDPPGDPATPLDDGASPDGPDGPAGDTGEANEAGNAEDGEAGVADAHDAAADARDASDASDSGSGGDASSDASGDGANSVPCRPPDGGAATICQAPSCCSLPTGTCTGSCGGDESTVLCDGPEDCVTGGPYCCQFNSIFSRCTSNPMCASYRFCHVDGDCAGLAGETCKGNVNGYKYCTL